MDYLYIHSFPYNRPCIPYSYDEVPGCRDEDIQELFWNSSNWVAVSYLFASAILTLVVSH
jgi:hypothetical protein